MQIHFHGERNITQVRLNRDGDFAVVEFPGGSIYLLREDVTKLSQGLDQVLAEWDEETEHTEALAEQTA